MTKEELLNELKLEIDRLERKSKNGGETYGLLDDANEVKRVLEGESFIMTAKRDDYADLIRIVAGERPKFIGEDGIAYFDDIEFRVWYNEKNWQTEKQLFVIWWHENDELVVW